MLAGKAKVLYVVGNMSFQERPDVDFLIVQASHMTDLVKQADIVLPAADTMESQGSVIDYLGRFKEVEQAVEPVGDSLPHRDIFVKIAKEKNISLKSSKTSDARKLAKAKAKLSVGEFRKKEGLDADPEQYMQAANMSVINGSRLFWLNEIEQAVTV
jgi:NADH dehydrogenase/NADH:ubiquinone oxidoreductase subunit G